MFIHVQILHIGRLTDTHLRVKRIDNGKVHCISKKLIVRDGDDIAVNEENLTDANLINTNDR